MVVTPASTLSLFADLSAKYTSWPEYKNWLKETEPDIDIIETEDSPYVILRNNKNREVDTLTPTASSQVEEDTQENETLSDVRQACRSVVWDTRSNRPCCVAPFAARRDQKIPFGTPLKVEDFVEGVMINVFRSRGDSETHVSTRSRIDANGKFYSEKSFRELFDEALKAKDSSLEAIEKMIGEPSDTVQSTFMSLVLAHPEHRVVRTVDNANLWAVYHGAVLNDGTVQFFMSDIPASWSPKSYATDFTPADWSQMKAKFEEIRSSKPWYWQGIVVHTGAGTERWRFRNGEHDRVRRDLRGAESNPLGRFLRLRSQKRVQEYLRIYSEDNEVFQKFEREYRSATKTLYTWYCRCHKEHNVKFKDLPKSVQPLIFEMHKYYLATLRPNQKSLHLLEVIAWISEYLKAQYSVSNVIRFMKETEEPPASKTPWPQAQVPQAQVPEVQVPQAQLPQAQVPEIQEETLDKPPRLVTLDTGVYYSAVAPSSPSSKNDDAAV